MAMEKYSTDRETLLQSLRNEEAELMQKMQTILGNPEKTAADRTAIEDRLQTVLCSL